MGKCGEFNEWKGRASSVEEKWGKYGILENKCRNEYLWSLVSNASNKEDEME